MDDLGIDAGTEQSHFSNRSHNDSTIGSKRVKLDLDELGRDHRSEVTNLVAKLILLQRRHQGLRAHIRSEDGPRSAGMIARLEAVNPRFEALNDIFADFTSLIEVTYRQLESAVEDSSQEIATQVDWWENTNLLAPDIDNNTIYPMLEYSPPTDATKYASFIRRHMYATIKLWSNHREHTFRLQTFLTRLFREIKRIYNLPGGTRQALQLGLDTLRAIVPFPVSDYRLGQGMALNYQKLEENIRDMLTDPRVRHKAGNFTIDMAENCRKLWKCALHDGLEDLDTRDNHCRYYLLLTTIDLLQRNAWVDIRINVLRAVGRRLPAELMELVFQNTLAAEQIPMDPRILVDVESTLERGKERMTACRLPCHHDQPPTKHNKVGPYRTWAVLGSEWVETEDSRRLAEPYWRLLEW
ncbi:hypothetical protein K491DRAFT_778714 [Lophiostoma macrostomum CBS 122681]|uniref:Uncharacterized protein n=1 Tax=Lophiostoma macrostomum CBS 122681 TaxID=1314788 RepID=A0A6A6TAB8_9PLEO|nr:hypothetical protein K491DRAFT_778714 [Lophiostoma macrostomum CBS 122681]